MEEKRKTDIYSMLLHEKKRLADLRANLQHLLCLTEAVSRKDEKKVDVEGDGRRMLIGFKKILKPTPMIQDGKLHFFFFYKKFAISPSPKFYRK